MDRVPTAQRQTLGLPGGTGVPLVSLDVPARGVHAKYTGEFREPQAGEWYLSGAYVGAYYAVNTLSTKFHIAKLVRTETEMVEVTTEI